MDPIITPAALLLGLFYIHSKTVPKKTDPAEVEANAPPADPALIEFSPEARATMLEPGTSPGLPAQRFKGPLRGILKKALGNESLSPLTVEGQDGRGVLLFQVIDGSGDLSVERAIALAELKKMAVLGSLSLAMPNLPRFVMLCPLSAACEIAEAGSAFALLSEPPALETAPAKVAEEPKAETEHGPAMQPAATVLPNKRPARKKAPEDPVVIETTAEPVQAAHMNGLSKTPSEAESEPSHDDAHS